ncbi:PAAR domain-containing protein [Pseudomonas sp. G2-4]|uniref:PAAR domain-containing protein n=1 Tax=Pseudomonas sp. G2-4 TaxID=1506334 RepID=UPI0024BA0587|nr:PAAR domain-containing protein [Pseudomonas sp. G2-4]WHS60249.1 PAAR domain-containing protein [Pseudomonas sp. G2-4]
MDAQAAARLGDEIAHGFGLAAMVAGAVAGALIGAAVVAATVATGGVALAIMAGSIAAGGLSMFQIVKGLSTIFNLPEPTTGALIMGSFNVYINSRNAMRAGEDTSSSCTGLPMNHPIWPFPVLIAEGSATVFINGKPAARLHSKMVCGAHIKTGSPNTFIGGPTVAVAFVLDLEGWMHTGLQALGLLAAGAALVMAAMAGIAVLVEFVVVGGLIFGAMELLGDLGDRLGPGYRDLLQGVAGMAMLGLSPKMAKAAKPAELPPPKYKPGVTEADILAMPKGSRPDADTYLSPQYVKEHLAQFENGASRFTTKNNLDKYGIAQRDGTTFLMPKAEADQLVANAKGDKRALEKALGLPENTLESSTLVRVDIPAPKDMNLRIPSGNEAGANEFWIPGGKLPTGASEAVIDAGGILPKDFSWTPL